MRKTLKEFVYDEAAKRGNPPHTIYVRILRGQYPTLKLERKNARVVFVLNENADFNPTLQPTTRRPVTLYV